MWDTVWKIGRYGGRDGTCGHTHAQVPTGLFCVLKSLILSNLPIPRPPKRMSKLQKKPSALKREHPALQNMKFLKFFSVFVGHFCPPGSGFRIRVRIPNQDLGTDPLTWWNPDTKYWFLSVSVCWKREPLCHLNLGLIALRRFTTYQEVLFCYVFLKSKHCLPSGFGRSWRFLKV